MLIPANIDPIFRNTKAIVGKRPNISHIRLQGDHNNNKMERFNGEVRDREKVMRGLKKKDTPILTGHTIVYMIIMKNI